MDKLASEIIDAHGGLSRWRSFSSLSAHLVQGGVLWTLKGKAGVLDDTNVTIDLRRERASHAPFGDASRKSVFTPTLVELALLRTLLRNGFQTQQDHREAVLLEVHLFVEGRRAEVTLYVDP